MAAVREKEDTDRERGKHEKRHEKTEIQAHQEMTDAANRKADKLEGEITKMKKTLSEMFSPQILDQIFPRVRWRCLRVRVTGDYGVCFHA